jgi:Flp pilus assembly protein TadB
LSLCSSFGRCIVCPFVLQRRTKGQTKQRPKEEQRDKQCNVQKKNKGTNNATSKRKTKGQTMQRPKEEQKDKQCNVQKKNKGTNNPLFFFWTLHCLSLCSSFGRCIVCPFVFLLDVALFVPLFFFWTLQTTTTKNKTKKQTNKSNNKNKSKQEKKTKEFSVFRLS